MSQLSGYEAVILVVYASAVGVGDRARSTGTGAVEGAGAGGGAGTSLGFHMSAFGNQSDALMRTV